MIVQDLLKIIYNQGSSCGDSSKVSHFIDDVVSDASTGGCLGENDDSVSSYSLSPGGRKYFIPICIGDMLKPFGNQEFQNLDEGYNFYKEYGRLIGFDVRKTTEKRDADGTIILKHFVCSKEGFNDVKSGSSNSCEVVKQRKTVSRRCGYKARLVLKIMSGKKYFVYAFDEKHNHPLVAEGGRQFLRANREMNISSRNFVFNAAKVNIGCSKAFGLMKEMVGGYANVGATLREYRNFERDLKEFVGERDAQMMIDKFKVMQESHLTKLFWADAIGRRYFELYGDAISFDATFDTNKYNMIFAPFTGVDKHDKCDTFAACLLSKEDVIHYKWAFDHFVKAMAKNPVVIVTDQCPAMKQAISASFCARDGSPASKHRLCMWHIMEKFPTKLDNHLCKETDFMEKMKTYIWSSIIEPADFEEGWEAVLKEFNLGDNKWLSDMYDLRESWIPAFFRGANVWFDEDNFKVRK